jgi:hypothetical protein
MGIMPVKRLCDIVMSDDQDGASTDPSSSPARSVRALLGHGVGLDGTGPGPRASRGGPAAEPRRVDPGPDGGSRQRGARGGSYPLGSPASPGWRPAVEALAPSTSRTPCSESAQAPQMNAPNTALWKLWKSLRDSHELPQGLLRRKTQAPDRLLNWGNSSAPIEM